MSQSPISPGTADYEYYRTLAGNEKLQLLLELIMPENPDAAIIERSARVHPLTEHGRKVFNQRTRA
jgi:hypothetical protein